MAHLNRPPNIIPRYRGPHSNRTNFLVDALNRANTGTPTPEGEFEPVDGESLSIEVGPTITIDGGGPAITTTSPSLGGATVLVTKPCTIIGWTVEADQSGAIVVDVLRANAGVPSASIIGSSGNNPTLSSAQFATAAQNGSWTSIQLNPGDIIGFSVISATTVQRVTVSLTVAC
jgi:hypothetical protein